MPETKPKQATTTVVPVTININIEQIANLLCSAFEGGSNYWYVIESARAPLNYDRYRSFPDTIIKHIDYPLNAHGGLTISTLEGDEFSGRTKWPLNYSACVRGLTVMAEKYPHHFTAVLDESDDATTGDVFLQCCLFGEVVYG